MELRSPCRGFLSPLCVFAALREKSPLFLSVSLSCPEPVEGVCFCSIFFSVEAPSSLAASVEQFHVITVIPRILSAIQIIEIAAMNADPPIRADFW